MNKRIKYRAILPIAIIGVAMLAPSAVGASASHHGTARQTRLSEVAKSIWSGVERPFKVQALSGLPIQAMSPAQRLAREFIRRRAESRPNLSGIPGAAGALFGSDGRPGSSQVSSRLLGSAAKATNEGSSIRRGLTVAPNWGASGAPRPAVAPDPEVTLDHISCPALEQCFAVGSYANGAGAFPGLILHESSGNWSAIAPPLPAGAFANGFVDLNGIDCPSPTECVAVGDYSDTAGSEDDGQADTRALVETLQAGNWTATKVSLPVNADFEPFASLASVACPIAGSCTAVGSYNVSGEPVPFVTTETNSGWTSQAAPVPASGNNGGGLDFESGYPTLVQVVCPAAGHCAAVGSYESESGGGALYDQDVNGTWSAIPVPKAGASFLDAVACSTSSACTAVGGIGTDYGEEFGYAVSEHGGKLTAVKTPLPKDAPAKKVGEVDLYSLACTASTCTAVGDWITESEEFSENGLTSTSGSGNPLVLTLTKGKWAAPVLSTDTHHQEGALYAVSCPATGACAAGGIYAGPNGDTTLLLTGSGSNWLPQALGGDPATGHGELLAVDCANGCTAVGLYIEIGGNRQGLVVSGGPSWVGSVAPLPGDAGSPQNIDLALVSCPVAGSCTALGTNEDRSIVVETLSGGSWSVSLLPNPSDLGWASQIYPNAISCTGPGECVAIADYYAASGALEGEILTETSGIWTEAAAPYPASSPPAVEGSLNAVDCPTTSTCVIGGTFVKRNGQLVGWIINDTSGSWTPYSAPAPAGQKLGKLSALYGLGCVSATNCTLVGIYGGDNRTLPFVATGGGASWKARGAAVPKKLGPTKGVSGYLDGVNCSTACVATGVAYTERAESSIIDAFSGASSQSVEAPGKALEKVLTTPSCSATTCEIVGSTYGNTSERALLITGWGTKWKIVTPASGKAPSGSYLGAVVCIAAGDCESVGGIGSQSQDDEDGSSQPLLAATSAGHSSLALAPLPVGAEAATGLEYADLDSVSCPADGACVSVGSYFDTNFVLQGLIEQQQQ